MSWNNITPWWLIMGKCPKCDHKVKDRAEFPGAECKECGGEAVREEEEETHVHD